jgi:hypothetical protein
MGEQVLFSVVIPEVADPPNLLPLQNGKVDLVIQIHNSNMTWT